METYVRFKITLKVSFDMINQKIHILTLIPIKLKTIALCVSTSFFVRTVYSNSL